MKMVAFRNEFAPLLDNYELQYSSFSNGDLGDLERVEFEGKNKIGTIDFWSSGWLGIELFDLKLNDQTMNLLLQPDDESQKRDALNLLMQTLLG
ncbi:hypothetical protein [Pantoea sp. At-9b]|uniref:hypothetical protein n=1 Tax=Pantoea sp. (strain At-9b) TaxID=592316 RepID=UPI0001B3FB26|nr:hypothetical protein [Pantoea sp. At-9b]ADU69233.1 conserved hypothetical protein [Pantoea sp. At-9b]